MAAVTRIPSEGQGLPQGLQACRATWQGVGPGEKRAGLGALARCREEGFPGPCGWVGAGNGGAARVGRTNTWVGRGPGPQAQSC